MEQEIYHDLNESENSHATSSMVNSSQGDAQPKLSWDL